MWVLIVLCVLYGADIVLTLIHTNEVKRKNIALKANNEMLLSLINGKTFREVTDEEGADEI